MQSASDILTTWIAEARRRNNTKLTLALWHARDIVDGIAVLYDQSGIPEEIREAFDAMDQNNEDLKLVRKEVGI